MLEQIRDSYTTQNGWNTARKYILMSGVERKNGWQLSEQLGEHTPYRLQQFYHRVKNSGLWDKIMAHLVKKVRVDHEKIQCPVMDWLIDKVPKQ